MDKLLLLGDLTPELLAANAPDGCQLGKRKLLAKTVGFPLNISRLTAISSVLLCRLHLQTNCGKLYISISYYRKI